MVSLAATAAAQAALSTGNWHRARCRLVCLLRPLGESRFERRSQLKHSLDDTDELQKPMGLESDQVHRLVLAFELAKSLKQHAYRLHVLDCSDRGANALDEFGRFKNLGSRFRVEAKRVLRRGVREVCQTSLPLRASTGRQHPRRVASRVTHATKQAKLVKPEVRRHMQESTLEWPSYAIRTFGV